MACKHTFFIASSLWKLHQTLCSLSGLSKHSCRASKIQTDNQARGSIEGFFVVVSLWNIRRIQRDSRELRLLMFSFFICFEPVMPLQAEQLMWIQADISSDINFSDSCGNSWSDPRGDGFWFTKCVSIILKIVKLTPKGKKNLPCI